MKAGAVDGRSLRRKHAGTGKHDTSPFTWAAMRREYIAGSEPLTDVARRHGVLYSAAHERLRMERWNELLPKAPPPPPIRATPSFPACPACGAGSRLRGLADNAVAYECSACQHRWQRRTGGPDLRLVPDAPQDEVRR